MCLHMLDKIRVSLSLLTLLLCIGSFAQNNASVNISFNVVFHYDSTSYLYDGEEFHFIQDPGASLLTVKCFDHDLEPDSSKLNQHLRNTVTNYNKLLDDSTDRDSIMNLQNAVIEIGRIELNEDFFGIYKIMKKTFNDSAHYFAQIDAYNYNEHCYCEFKYKRSFYTDSASLTDTARAAMFLDGLDVRSMDQVRMENDTIRNFYTVSIDTLPQDNYWIWVRYVDARMKRDTLHIEDLDSVNYLPRFTHYNITYKAMIVIKPQLNHTISGVELKNMKNYTIKGDTVIIEVRDAQAGIIERRGTITVLNSLGYPVDLPFYIKYRNHIYERLSRN